MNKGSTIYIKKDFYTECEKNKFLNRNKAGRPRKRHPQASSNHYNTLSKGIINSCNGNTYDNRFSPDNNFNINNPDKLMNENAYNSDCFPTPPIYQQNFQNDDDVEFIIDGYEIGHSSGLLAAEVEHEPENMDLKTEYPFCSKEDFICFFERMETYDFS